MNAQEEWKAWYQAFTLIQIQVSRDNYRYSMLDCRREAALERRISAQQRQHEADQRRIEELQREIDYLRSTDHAADMAMEQCEHGTLEGWNIY